MRCNRCYRPMAGTTPADGACACGGLIEASPLIDHERRALLLNHFAEKWLKDGTVCVYGGYEEAEGLPTLPKMSDLAKHLGASVDHIGYGCFVARAYSRKDLFGFLGGGAMTHEPRFSWSALSFDDPPLRLKILAWLRKNCPAGFARAEQIVAERQLQRIAGFVAGERLAKALANGGTR